MVQLSLAGARGDDREPKPIEVPAELRPGWPENVVPGNVARAYARTAADLRDDTRTAPTFDDAVAVHRTIAAIEEAAREAIVSLSAIRNNVPSGRDRPPDQFEMMRHLTLMATTSTSGKARSHSPAAEPCGNSQATAPASAISRLELATSTIPKSSCANRSTGTFRTARRASSRL